MTFAGNYHGHADPLLVNAGVRCFGNKKCIIAWCAVVKAVSDTISLRYNNVSDIEKLI